MGNLLKDSNGNIVIPKTKIHLSVRPSNYDPNPQLLQKRVFQFSRAWEVAGFKVELSSFESRDQINDGMYERTFGANSRTPYQQEGCYIDFNKSEIGQAYQKVIPEDLFAKASDYISINEQRANILQADVVHEFGHLLGLAHEHQRIDREGFVVPQDSTDYQQKIEGGQQIKADDKFVPFGWYDPQSVMHYPGIFKLINGTPIGGDKQAPQFSNVPSLGDRMTAHFLYNEARIKEELEAQKKRISDEKTSYSNNMAPLSIAFASPNPLTPRGLTEHINKQQTRLEKLKNISNPSFDATIERTYLAVQDQCQQLQLLKLFEARDQELIDWSTHQFQQFRKSRDTAPHP
jgi:hypothetical protein